MSLRRRVLLGCAAVALVLLVADLALASAFRGFLLGHVDEQLTESAERLLGFATAPNRPAPHGPGSGRLGRTEGRAAGGRPLSEFYVAVADADGRVLGRLDTPLRAGRADPELAAEQVRAHATVPTAALEPFTVGAVDDDGWRLVALRPEGPGGEIVLIGASLDDVGATYQRILAVW